MSPPNLKLKTGTKVNAIIGRKQKSPPPTPKLVQTNNVVPQQQPTVPKAIPFTAVDFKKLEKELADLDQPTLDAAAKIREAFGKTETIEDIATLKGEERKKRAGEVKAALQPVPDLIDQYRLLQGEIVDVRKPALFELQGVTDDQLGELAKQATAKRNRLANAVPEGVMASVGSDWAKALPLQMDSLLTDKQTQKGALALAKKQTAEVQKAGGELTDVVEKYQVWTMGRASSFFDAPRSGVAMSKEDQLASMKANDVLAEKGRAILYNGGTYKDVKELMKSSGLTEEWWPPQLVESVQAWRKTQRAINDERVTELAKSQVKGNYSIENLSAASEYIGSNFEMDATFRELAEDKGVLAAVDNWISSITSGLSGIEGAYEFIKNPLELIGKLKDGEAIEISEILEKSLATLQGGLKSAISGMTIAQNFAGDPIKELMKKVVPGLSLAAAGVDLLAACKELGQHAAVLNKAKKEKRQALGGFATDDVDESMVNAIRNEIGARKVQVAKDSVEVGTGILDVGGAGANTFGGAHGQAAGAVITVVSGAIKLGAKVIFSGIDWSKAQAAQATIKQAQAGNMVAQIEVFEDSGFYAKMYIAVLCRDNQAMAKKFVIDRGIEEGDLDNVMGLKILREELLKSADQIDDTKVEGGLAKYVFGAPGMVVGKGLDLIGSGAKGLGNAIRSVGTKPYNAGWKYSKDQITLTAAGWKTMKDSAIEAGLIDNSTGIGDTLTKVEKSIADADLVCPDPKAPKQGDSDDPKGEKAAKLKAGIAGVRELTQSLWSMKPEAYNGIKPIPHAGMAVAMRDMIAIANKKEEAYFAGLSVLGGFKPDWQPTVKLDKISSADWTSLWNEGVKLAALPSSDAGVAAGLKLAEDTELAWQKLKTEKDKGPEKRAHILEHMGTIEDAKACIDKCRAIPEVGIQTKLGAEIDTLVLKLNERLRLLDTFLSGKSDDPTINASWPNPPSLTFTDGKYGETWKGLWDKALKDGFRNPKKGDAGMAEKLAAFDKGIGLVTTAKDGQAKLKAFASLLADAGAVKQASLDFGRLHRYSAEALKTGATDMAEQCAKRAQELKKAQPEVDFAISTDYTPKGWTTVYENAIAKNALMKSGTAKSSLKKALEEQAKAAVKYINAKGPKEKRKTAETYLGSLRRTVEMIEMVMSLKDYGTHKKMKEYLEKMKHAVEALITKPLEADANGSAVTTFALVSPVSLNPDDWSKNKNKAVDEGVLPDEKSGIKAQITDFGKADAEYLKNKTDKKLVAKQQEAATQLIATLKALKVASQNKVWQTYCQDLANAATAKRAA